MIGVGIGLPFYRSFGSGIDAQAQVHFNRVIADGGLVPSGLSGVNAFFSAIKAIYGTTDINTAISAAYDAHYLGYKLGAGSGTTLGQAAQKLYSVKSTENLLLQSEDFSNAYWVKNLGTITQNNTIAPDGTLTADLFTKTSGINTVSRVGRNTPFTTTGIHTLSIFVKPSVGNLIQLRLDVDGNTANSTFNFTTKTFTNSGANVISSSFQELPDGWFRLILTGNVLLTTWSVDVCLLFSNPTNDAMWLWGAQVNTGSVALPYTPTTTTTQTLADVTQTTAASQPLLLAHTGENYWFSPLSVSDNCSTPNAIANRITGDIEFIFNFSYYSLFNANFISKRSGGTDISYAVNTQFQGRPQLIFSQNGSTIITSTSSVAITTATNWLKVTRTQSNGDVVFYTSTNGTTWTQLGTTQSTASGNIFSGTAPLLVGQNAFNGTDGMGGKMYRATISNSIGGTPVVDFNPASYNPATSQTQWTSATGEVWSLNVGTATSGYKSALVDRSLVQLDRTDDSMSIALTSTMQTSLSTNCGFGLVATRFTNSNNEFVATLGGDFTANNSTQVWLQGSTLGVDIATAGTVRAGVTATGTYTLARRFSYVDNIVYGGATTQVLNATSNSGVYFNNTTNKPAITSGNFVLGSSGFGRLNGNVFTFVMAIDGTKFNQLNTSLRTFNNNFAL